MKFVIPLRSAYLTMMALALLGLTGCSKEEPFVKPALPVKIQKVEASRAGTRLKYSATVVAREQVDLAFKVGGYVENILKLPGPDGIERDVEKGDQIPEGTILAQIRESDYRAKLNQAKSALEEARASLGQATRDFERAEKLIQADVLSKNDYERSREKLDLAKARSNGAESQVEVAQLQIQDTVLKSPMDCVVVSRLVERGTLVASGTRAFVLANLKSVKAVFGVPDYVLRRIKTGDQLTIKVEALNKEFLGTVTAVSPSADPKSRVFQVEITVANQDLVLKEGMIATVRLVGAADRGMVPVIPIHAVVRPPSDPRGFMVYLVDEQGGTPKARGRKVVLGSVIGDKVVVTEGLSVGEKIITTGATLASEGAALMIMH